MTGSNGQISIENSISVSEENAGLLITQPGSILLEANFFINVVSSLPDVTLTFEEIEKGEDISMALLPKSTSRFVLIGNDVRWKHLVEEEINLVGVLTLEDLHILLEQSMYEI